MKPHEIIAEPILNELKAAIERGDNGKWIPPWRGAGMPLRSCGKPYTGINTLLLAVSANINSFSSSYWFTFNDAKKRGLRLVKGSKSTAICFYKSYEKKDKETGETESRRVLRYYRVFNGSQFESLPKEFQESTETVAVNAEPLKVIQACGVPVKLEGLRAFYSPKHDSITLPPVCEFTSQAGFNGTALHELIHATGHKSRLDRPLNNRFGDHAYAAEELVAEFGATLLCAWFGYEYQLEHHASYLESWYKAIKDNPSVLTTAGAAAQKAMSWVIDQNEAKEAA